MAFREIRERIKYPKGVTERFKVLDAFQRVMDGTIYEHLPFPFSQEEDAGVYVAIEDRRPSVKLPLARVLRDQTSGLLWADEQMPHFVARNVKRERVQRAEAILDQLVVDEQLDLVMTEAYEVGFAQGTVAIIVRALDGGRADYEIVEGKFVTPYFDVRDRHKLVKLVVQYPVKTGDLDPDTLTEDGKKEPFHWFRVELDAFEERRFKPLPQSEFEQLGETRNDGTVIAWVIEPPYPLPHKWGMVPAIIGRNLVGRRSQGVDGESSFAPVVDTLVEIDYEKSGIGRGIRYMADPTLAIENNGGGLGAVARRLKAAGPDEADDVLYDARGAKVKGVSSVFRTGPGETVKLLEITGAGLEVANKNVDRLREDVLEVLGGNKASAENTKAASSGRALEMLAQALYLIVKRQRTAYGRCALVPLVRILLAGVVCGELKLAGLTPRKALRLLSLVLDLLFPPMRKLEGAELLAAAQAWGILMGATPATPKAILPDDKVTELAATDLGYNDVGAIVSEMKGTRAQVAENDELDKDEDEAAGGDAGA